MKEKAGLYKPQSSQKPTSPKLGSQLMRWVRVWSCPDTAVCPCISR